MNVFLRRTRAQQKYKIAFNLHSLQRQAKSRLPPAPQRPFKIALKSLKKMSSLSLFRSSSKIFIVKPCKGHQYLPDENHPQLHKKHDIPIGP